MQLDKFIQELEVHNAAYPEATVQVMDQSDSLPKGIKEVLLESDPDSTGPTLWLMVEES